MTRHLTGLLALAILCLSPLFAHASDGKPQGPLPLADVRFDFESFPKPGDIYAYKGHYIVGSADADVDNVPFLRSAKKAIDLIDELPNATKQGAKLIKAIIYNPPLAKAKERKANTADNPNDAILPMFPAVYTYGKSIEQDAPMIVQKDAQFLAPITIAYAFVSNIVYAQLHAEIISMRKRARGMDRSSSAFKALIKKHNALLEVVQKLNKSSDLDLVHKVNCRQMANVLAAMKAWQEPAQKISGIYTSLNEEGCMK